METRRFAIAQWDVFSSTALEGNSLAILFDARGLSDDEMQAIAKETNLSETTFVFPRDKQVERERGGGCASSRSRKNCLLLDIRPWERHSPCAEAVVPQKSLWI